ncbi:unnamed protein product [Adineta ricciae]|uniref:Uncharacterized protein n=1 Tax=Adineta ricciae TaxID=249248 RepID=A0A815XCI4_ADIRI|nr:unnamed protein product [Adineta ricciae]
MININNALGSSSTISYTNVPILISGNNSIFLHSIFTDLFSNYSQAGAQYCGIVNQMNIANAINIQATG